MLSVTTYMTKKFYAILIYLFLPHKAFTFISNLLLELNHLNNSFRSRNA